MVVVLNIVYCLAVAGVFGAAALGFLVGSHPDHPDPLWAIALMLSVIAASLIRIANKT